MERGGRRRERGAKGYFECRIAPTVRKCTGRHCRRASVARIVPSAADPGDDIGPQEALDDQHEADRRNE